MVAGAEVLLSAGDMLLMSTVGVDWLDSPAELDSSFPAAGENRTRAARALENLF